MIYVRDGLPYRVRPDLEDENIESCVIEVTRSKCKKLFIWTIYRAPDSPLGGFIDILNSKMEQLPQIILPGNFHVDFVMTGRASGHSLKRKLTLCANKFDLNQLIETPTRVTEQSSTAIDLLFVNNKHRVVSSVVFAVHIIDHSLIYCVVKSGVSKGPWRTIEYKSYKHYSKEAFLADLWNVDWDILDEISDIDAAVTSWNKLFMDIRQTIMLLLRKPE